MKQYREIKARNLICPESQDYSDLYAGILEHARDIIRIEKAIHSVVGRQFVASFKTCQRSFLALKKAIANAPGLSHPCYDQQFILETDASDFAIGAVFG